MSCDLWPLICGLRIRTWPAFQCHLPTHQKYSKSVQHFWSNIVRKSIWIYNELWPLTFDLRTPNSNLTCILVSSTYISKISRIRPRFLKLLCGNQFGGRTDGRTDGQTDRRTDGQVQRIMPPPDFVCGGIKMWTTPFAQNVNHTICTKCEPHHLHNIWTTPSTQNVNHTICTKSKPHKHKMWTTPFAQILNHISTKCEPHHLHKI